MQGALSLAVQAIMSVCLAIREQVISSFVWIDPRSLRSIIACILQTIMPLHKLESGHAKLGEIIVGHVPAREISHVVWYFNEHDGAESSMKKW